jgi:hypothetical protein
MTKETTEEWKPVVGYEGRYEVSTLGRVKSLPNSRRRSSLILKPHSCKRGGYFTVGLVSNDGVRWAQKTTFVHLIVLTAFVGPSPGAEYQCCHGDGNTGNTSLSNLRWDTLSGNQMDRVAHGTSNRGVQNGHAKLTEEQALQVKARIRSGASNEEIAGEFPVTPYAVKNIRNGYNWSWL